MFHVLCFMKILFISRAYPPIIGGIENQNAALAKWLAKVDDVEIETIANTKGKKYLPVFFPKAFFLALFKLHKYDIILLGDGVLAIVGCFLRLFTRKPVVTVLHGLDITYRNLVYQLLWVKGFLRLLSGALAVSRHTKETAIAHGLREEKIRVVPNGVEDPIEPSIPYRREDLALYLKENIDDKKILVTIGRMVRRKGVAWFAERVLPKLPDNVLYVVAGSGSEKEKRNILDSAARANTSQKLRLLGSVPDEIKIMLHRTSDLFIQPNILVPGDREGFGIAVIEASLAGLPVVASQLEGLKDAVIDKETGFFAEPGNPESFVAAILPLLENTIARNTFSEKARTVTRERFHWDSVSKTFATELESFLPKK